MKYFFLLISLIFCSCQSQLVEPENIVIEGFQIGQGVDLSEVSKIEPLFYPELQEVESTLFDFGSSEYFNLPIDSYKLNKNENIIFTLLDSIIIEITVNNYSTSQRDRLVNIFTQKYQGEPVFKEESKKQFLQPYTIKTATYTWKTKESKTQISAGYMKKTKAEDQPFDHWTLTYANRRLKNRIVEDYKKGIFKNEKDSLAYAKALQIHKNRISPPRNGTYTDIYDNGNNKVTGFYKKGREDGEWLRWFENGQLKEKGSYQKGKKMGVWEEWHENGVKADSATYKKDEYIGQRLMWHPNGQLLLDSYWSNRHQQIGTWTRYYENGQMESLSEMDNKGNDHGKFLLYCKDGNIQREIIYKHGREVSNKYWSKSGRLRKY